MGTQGHQCRLAVTLSNLDGLATANHATQRRRIACRPAASSNARGVMQKNGCVVMFEWGPSYVTLYYVCNGRSLWSWSTTTFSLQQEHHCSSSNAWFGAHIMSLQHQITLDLAPVSDSRHALGLPHHIKQYTTYHLLLWFDWVAVQSRYPNSRRRYINWRRLKLLFAANVNVIHGLVINNIIPSLYSA